MKKYALLQDVLLSFLNGNDQIDALFGPLEHCYLECDGKTIWVVNVEKNRRDESITMANAIDVWIERNKIKEI